MAGFLKRVLGRSKAPDQEAEQPADGADEQQAAQPADAPEAAAGDAVAPAAADETVEAPGAEAAAAESVAGEDAVEPVAVADPVAGSQEMFARLTQTYGAAFADQAVRDGLTLAQAHERRVGQLAGELAEVQARLATHLNENGGMGAPDPASFSEGATEKMRAQSAEESRLAASVGPRLAKVAAAMEVSKRAPKSK